MEYAGAFRQKPLEYTPLRDERLARARKLSRARAVALVCLFAFSVPRLALAKKVTVEWEALDEAVEYELKVQLGAKTVLTKKLPATKWKGDLPFGAYTYQLRSIDKANRPGEWGAVRPLVVMARPPQPTEPKDGVKFRFFDPKRKFTVKWSAVENVSKYHLEVKRGKEVVLERTVEGTSTDVRELPSGEYTWTVKSVVVGKERSWESEASSSYDFILEIGKLVKPTLLFPLDPIPPPSDNLLTLQWTKVDGAEAYEVRIIRLTKKDVGRNLASDFQKTKSFIAKDNSFTIKTGADAYYGWQVRALAHVDDKPRPGAIGPESTAQFQIDRQSVFTEGSGYVALSTMLAPYTYRSVSPLAGSSGRAQSMSDTWRVSGEYWFAPHWGAAAGVDRTTFTLSNSVFNRLNYEFTAKYRMSITHQKYGWFFAPKAGLQMAQYILLAITQPGAGSSSASLQETDIMATGLSVGFDLRKQFSDKWSLGIKTAYFLPLMLSGAPSGYSLSPVASYRNMSVGAQALYWINGRWGLSGGAYVETRSISYGPAGADASASEQVWMDGAYFYGSLLYTFGR